MNSPRQRSCWAPIQDAIFNPLSGLLVALSVVLLGLNVRVPMVDAPAFVWLFGLVPLWLIAVLADAVSRQVDEGTASHVSRVQYDVDHIANRHLRMVVTQAVAYRELIDKAIVRFQSLAMRGRLQDVANQIDNWVGRIYALARHLDAFRNDSIINDDLHHVPGAIRQLHDRLSSETDACVRHEIEDTMAHRQEQLQTLKKLDTSMDRAELQLENTLTALGTVYSQILMLDARDMDGSKAQRLYSSIGDQLNSLVDVQSSLDEEYQVGSNQSQTAHS